MIMLPESTAHNFFKINSMLKAVPLGPKQIHKSLQGISLLYFY